MEKFSKKYREKMEQIYLIAEQSGLVRESLEFEKNFEDKCPYWNDTLTSRKFRLLENGYLQVSVDDFDRWANSFLFEEQLATTLDKFEKQIQEMRIIQPAKESKPKIKVKYSR